MDEREKLARARQQVAAMTGFYFHLAVFVVVIGLLFIINAMAGKVWWVQWPLIGWGLFVLAHGAVVFGNIPGFIRNWQQRKTKELADRM